MKGAPGTPRTQDWGPCSQGHVRGSVCASDRNSPACFFLGCSARSPRPLFPGGIQRLEGAWAGLLLPTVSSALMRAPSACGDKGEQTGKQTYQLAEQGAPSGADQPPVAGWGGRDWPFPCAGHSLCAFEPLVQQWGSQPSWGERTGWIHALWKCT